MMIRWLNLKLFVKPNISQLHRKHTLRMKKKLHFIYMCINKENKTCSSRRVNKQFSNIHLRNINIKLVKRWNLMYIYTISTDINISHLISGANGCPGFVFCCWASPMLHTLRKKKKLHFIDMCIKKENKKCSSQRVNIKIF